MPLQVLERTPDPRQAQVLNSMKDLREAMAAQKQAKLYEFQLKAMSRNADNEEKKMDLDRKSKFVADAMKLKEMGAGENAIEILHSLYGEDVIPYANDLGKELAKASGSEKSQLQGSQRRALDQFTGGSMPAGTEAPPLNDLSEGGQAMAMPTRGGVMSGNRPVATQANIGGMTLVNPEAKAAVTTAETRAKNEEDLRSGKLTTDEQGVMAVGKEATRALDSVLNKIENTKFSDWDKLVIDSKSSLLAGNAKNREVQADLNNVKAVMNKLMGYGAAFTDGEIRLVEAVSSLSFKDKATMQKNIGFLRNIFQNKVDLIRSGRQSDVMSPTAPSSRAQTLSPTDISQFTVTPVAAGE